MKSSLIYSQLPTERSNPASRNFDRLPLAKALAIINKEDGKVPLAVWKERKSIERAVRLIVESLGSGGRLIFIGAGTSGRLGVIEAAECPPTFSTPLELVQAFIAGGPDSVFASKEGAEDDSGEAAQTINGSVRNGDVVVGIAASGFTPYVQSALKSAQSINAATIFLTCNPSVPKNLADVTIAIDTGPEVIAGSTRLKAGTATKLVLNMLTVLTMTQLGKVLGNRMIDVSPRSKKLRARAVGLIRLFTGVDEKAATRLLADSKGSVKLAILMTKKKIPRDKAMDLLKLAGGHLYKAIRFQI